MSLLSFVKEGLSNVKQTAKTIAANTLSSIGVSNSFVKANTSSFSSSIPLAAKVAEHPFATAGVITFVANPTATLSVAKSVASKAVSAISSTFNSLGIGGKVATVVATPVVVSTLASSSKARSSVVSAPSKLVTFGSNIGNVIDNPSITTAKTLVTESPILTASTVLAGAALAGGGIGLAANTAATYLNSTATKKNTLATLGGVEDAVTTSIGPSSSLSKAEINLQEKALEAQIELQKLQGKQQLDIIEAQTKAAKELAALPVATVPSSITPDSSIGAVATPTTKKTTKKKKKATKKKTKKKKAKKKTTKKKSKKKAKSIKRRKKNKR